MAVVASPAYLTGKTVPKKPQDLAAHRCINLRLPTHGKPLRLEFENGQQSINVRLGFACVPFDLVQAHIAEGTLVAALHDGSPSFPGYHLHDANRRQLAPALALVIAALRYRAP